MITRWACCATALVAGLSLAPAEPAAIADPSPAPRTLPLEECIATALQNNHRRPASRFAVEIAEAQHRQALAGYWPQARLTGGYVRTDEAPDFIFPASTMGLPSQTITTSALTALITVPAGVLGPTALQLPVSVPAQTITTPAQAFPVPTQRIKLMDPDSVAASFSVSWLLFDGGMRNGWQTQAARAIDAMKAEARRTDLEITDSVKRLYYGAVLAHQLRQLGTDTLARMDATLQLTETLYKGGGGKVTKADYLENKIMVESLRAIVASLEKNEAMAQAALANTMGLPWQASITPQAKDISVSESAFNLNDLVATAYEFSPDWKALEAGLGAADARVKTARSGHAPRVALTGNLHKWWNGYNAGMATEANKQGWTIGLAVDVPVFDGLLTRSRIAEARARLAQLKQQQLLLKEGIGLQIKDTFLGLAAARQAFTATQAAETAAVENRELNVRAYQSELVDTEKVIRAQLVEAFMTAQHLKARYDTVALESQLALLVGTEITRQLNLRP